MAAVVDSIRMHVDGSFEPMKGLDFGCGVGRLTIPMASFCRSIVAADISEFMLAEAKKNCTITGITNVEFAVSDDQLSKISGTFGFINSYLVFQHIPRKRGMAIFKRLLGLLEDNGVGVFHFTYFRESSKLIRLAYWTRKSFPIVNILANLILRRPYGQPMMEINEYRLNDILLELQLGECNLSHIDFSIHCVPFETVLGAMIFCKKKKSRN